MNLCHYCSNESFISIISTKEIWASEFSLSNDIMEGKWIREIFSKYCDEKSVTASNQNALLRHLDSLIAFSGGAGFCMSEDGDLLSQWRAYASNGGGVSIGFDSEYLKSLGSLKRDRNDKFNASLTKVEYDVAAQRKLVAEHLDEILTLVSEGALQRPTLLGFVSEDEDQKIKKKFHSMTLRFLFFFFYLYSLKNPAFSEEREWRIISHLLKTPSNEGFGKFCEMEFRARPDRIVPFIPIKLEPLERRPINEIILGPRNITPEEIVRGLLQKHGWNEVAVRRSKASYR